MVREYDSVGIQVLLAAPAKTLCGALQRHGFFKRYSSERLFHSVASAVRYAKDGHRVVRGLCIKISTLDLYIYIYILSDG